MSEAGRTPSGSNAAAEPAPESVLGHGEFADRLLAMAGGARQDITIFSFDLDRRVYGADPLVGVLRRFLLEHRRGRLRGLVNQPRAAVLGSHRLVELARVLSSRIEFRESPSHCAEATLDCIVIDQRSLLIREHPQELEARYYANSPGLAREHLRRFESIWQGSNPAREFTDLAI